jgi:hypothetical protein
MANYYEDLGLNPQVSVEEIRSAIDGRYNQWRELTTHPDAEVRVEADRNQRLLEQMRTTLTDPTKRAIYDAGIGLSGTGGLADPEALLKRAPPPPKPKVPPSRSPDATTLWSCHRCGTENPEWTQYCLNCRAELVRRCPECGHLRSLVKTGTCGNCGFEYQAAERRVALHHEMESLREQQNQSEKTIENLRYQIRGLEQANPSLSLFYIIFGIPGGVCFIGGIYALFSGEIGLWEASFVILMGLALLVAIPIMIRNLRRSHDAALARAAEMRQRITTLQEEIANLQAQSEKLAAEHDRIGRAKGLN